jgi:hypothetical protein
MMTSLICPACGRTFDPANLLFACPCLGDGREHALGIAQAADGAAPARLAESLLADWRAHPADPFAAFASLSAAAAVAGPDRYRADAGRLQEALRDSEGGPVAVTPLVAAPTLAQALGHAGTILVKDETGQVAGSHKIRHLAGTLLYLQSRVATARPQLAIQSCGNAALAAAAVARAAGYRLKTFVPEDVDPTVAALLSERGATVTIVPRQATGAGDPCYLAFRHAVADDGCIPFSCSGRDNWANIDGGRSLGFETALGWRDRGEAPAHLVVQVGGGALARSIAEGFALLAEIGVIARMPAIHVCQTEGAFPFVRAWLLLLGAVAHRGDLSGGPSYDRDAPRAALDGVRQALWRDRAWISRAVAFARSEPALVADVLDQAARTPAAFMWAWDGDAPVSLAHGILDDETYDWLSLARLMLKSGGQAITISEDLVGQAHALSKSRTAIRASATGSAGLAGLIALKDQGVIGPADSVGLFFTGVDRD